MSSPVERRGFNPITLNRVFVVSLVLVAAFGTWGLIDPVGMSGTSLGFTSFMLTSIGWYWLLISTGVLILAGFLAFGPYGHVKLGTDDEEPEFCGTGADPGAAVGRDR